jgi:hypothetical protein
VVLAEREEGGVVVHVFTRERIVHVTLERVILVAGMGTENFDVATDAWDKEALAIAGDCEATRRWGVDRTRSLVIRRVRVQTVRKIPSSNSTVGACGYDEHAARSGLETGHLAVVRRS